MPGNITDGAESCAADLAGAFSDIVGHGENLVGVLVKQEMVIAEIPAAHVPVEILGLHVECKCVAKQVTELFRYFHNAVMLDIRGGLDGSRFARSGRSLAIFSHNFLPLKF